MQCVLNIYSEKNIEVSTRARLHEWMCILTTQSSSRCKYRLISNSASTEFESTLASYFYKVSHETVRKQSIRSSENAQTVWLKGKGAVEMKIVSTMIAARHLAESLCLQSCLATGNAR